VLTLGGLFFSWSFFLYASPHWIDVDVRHIAGRGKRLLLNAAYLTRQQLHQGSLLQLVPALVPCTGDTPH
jgi:hypothetical protein